MKKLHNRVALALAGLSVSAVLAVPAYAATTSTTTNTSTTSSSSVAQSSENQEAKRVAQNIQMAGDLFSEIAKQYPDATAFAHFNRGSHPPHENGGPGPRGDRGQVEGDIQEESNDAPPPSDAPPTAGKHDVSDREGQGKLPREPLGKKLGIDPQGHTPGTYDDAALQEKYDDWLKRSQTSIDEAYKAAIEVEQYNISSIDKAIAATSDTAVKQELEEIRERATENLNRFTRASNGEIIEEPSRGPNYDQRGPQHGPKENSQNYGSSEKNSESLSAN